MSTEKFEFVGKIAKVDSSLGLVIGWGLVCKINSENYFDTQGDHIPEDAMLEAATEFMTSSRMVKDMHGGEALPGSIVFAFPLTTEIAKAFGIETNMTGLMVAMKPDSPEILEKYKSGEYTGFSIGGYRITDEEVA